MKVGSLFTGIGGLDLGLQRAGFEIAWQCEINPYNLQVLARHWPYVPRFADVRLLLVTDLPPVDVLCGGFPCQDISLAGQRKGLHGEQSSLWFEFLRLIRGLRPRYVLIENVAAIYYALNKDQEIPESAIQRVLLDLAQCGYDAEWRTFCAAQWGYPQYRQRCFIVAYPHGYGRASLFGELAPFEFPFGEGSGSKLDQRRRLLQEYESRLGEPAVFGANPGIPYRLERLTAIGNSVVPDIAQFIGERLLRFDAIVSHDQAASLVENG